MLRKKRNLNQKMKMMMKKRMNTNLMKMILLREKLLDRERGSNLLVEEL